MAETVKYDSKTTALITLDCQKGIVGMIPNCERIFKPADQVVDWARGKRIPVIHVGIGFRAGYPEVNPEHPTFSMIRSTGKFVIGSESAEFHDSIATKDNEIVVDSSFPRYQALGFIRHCHQRNCSLHCSAGLRS